MQKKGANSRTVWAVQIEFLLTSSSYNRPRLQSKRSIQFTCVSCSFYRWLTWAKANKRVDVFFLIIFHHFHFGNWWFFSLSIPGFFSLSIFGLIEMRHYNVNRLILDHQIIYNRYKVVWARMKRSHMLWPDQYKS